MRLLLDTHVLVWWVDDSRNLGRKARSAISRNGTELYISAISIWEISIKTAAKRMGLKTPLEDSIPIMLEEGAQSLSVTFTHAYAVRYLSHHHGDPFDRMLIAQAQCEGLTIVTADPAFRAYDVPVLDAST